MNTGSTERPLRVIKIGGSLLTLQDLPHRFANWLQREPASVNLLVIGGGAEVRRLQREQSRRGLSMETAHFCAIDAMHQNGLQFIERLRQATSLICQVLDARLAVRHVSNGAVQESRICLLDLRAWSRANQSLPRDWRTTSDSLAATIAGELVGADLAILKSALPPYLGLTELAASGYVDSVFPEAARGLPAVRFVNLRGGEFQERSAKN